jgi:hypothetical protein
MANYIKLTWTNSCDLGTIYYAGGFENKLFLDAEIGAPDYEDVEEGEENDEGVFIKTLEKLQKVHKFQCYVPEYLADALKLLPLHDDVQIFYTNGLYSSAIRNIKVDVEWDSGSNECMALVTVSYQQDDQVVKDNCCTAL